MPVVNNIKQKQLTIFSRDPVVLQIRPLYWNSWVICQTQVEVVSVCLKFFVVVLYLLCFVQFFLVVC